MTELMQAAEDYLRLRRGLGYKLETAGWRLPDFVRFLEAEGATYITTELALRWARESSVPASDGWTRRIAMVRGFATYMHARDARTQIPPAELAPRRKNPKLRPYVYSDDDIRSLMDAARTLRGLRGSTYSTLLGLLATTGMRVGEAIGLERADVDWRGHQLTIRKGKFGKSRELPLHVTTIDALRAYSRERDRELEAPGSPAFFLSLAGTRLHYKNVHFSFLKLLDVAGLSEREQNRPRIHDLRHTFTIKTLIEWYRDGDDVQARLPSLSTYLGHVDPATTYWYLTATPELLQLASRRLERTLGELP